MSFGEVRESHQGQHSIAPTGDNANEIDVLNDIGTMMRIGAMSWRFS
jgi:hypothetical protein